MLNFNLKVGLSQFMKIKTESKKETEKAGKKIAEAIKKEGRPTKIGLKGELGSGKTTFVRGFAEEFGLKEITSPTFVIMKKYEIEGRFKFFYHVDCYRIATKSNLSEIDFESVVQGPENIVLVEWPGRLTNFPDEGEIIEFEFISKNRRRIKVPDMFRLNKADF